MSTGSELHCAGYCFVLTQLYVLLEMQANAQTVAPASRHVTSYACKVENMAGMQT